MPSTRKFAMCAMDPFSASSDGCTVPTYPAVPTFKRRGYQSAVVKASNASANTGHAFIAVVPNLSGNLGQVFASKDNNPNAKIKIDSVSAAANIYACPEFPKNTTLLDGDDTAEASYSGRIVGIGLRVRYIGKDDDLSGLIYGRVAPNHQSLNNQSVADWSGQVQTICVPVSREWATVCSVGVKREEFEFPLWNMGHTADSETLTTVYPWCGGKAVTAAGADDNVGCPIMAFQIEGAQSGAPFQWEYVIHNEYIGQATSGIKTPNPTEPSALGMVTSVQNNKNVSRQDIRVPGMCLVKAAQETYNPYASQVFGEVFAEYSNELTASAKSYAGYAGAHTLPLVFAAATYAGSRLGKQDVSHLSI